MLGFVWILLGGQKDIFQSAARASLNVYTAPLLLAFALLLGARSGMNIPLTAEANWVFQMTEIGGILRGPSPDPLQPDSTRDR